MKLQPFIIVFVDVLATTAVFILTKAAAVAKASTKKQ